MVRTRTKKLRGGHYGRGMKSGRGKGKRGGHGMAGLNKHKFVWLLKNDPKHYGVHGFTSHHPGVGDVPLTLSELSTRLEYLKEKGFAKMDGEILTINLTEAGFTKLLGSGDFREKSKIIVEKATEKALNKLSPLGITVETDGRDSQE